MTGAVQRLKLWDVLTVSAQQVVDDAARNMRPQVRTRLILATGDFRLHTRMSYAGLAVWAGDYVCMGGPDSVTTKLTILPVAYLEC